MPNVKQITPDDDRLMTRKQLAEYLQVSAETISKWKTTGERNVPEVDIGGRLIRYRKSEIDAWLASGVKFNPVG